MDVAVQALAGHVGANAHTLALLAAAGGGPGEVFAQAHPAWDGPSVRISTPTDVDLTLRHPLLESARRRRLLERASLESVHWYVRDMLEMSPDRDTHPDAVAVCARGSRTMVSSAERAMTILGHPAVTAHDQLRALRKAVQHPRLNDVDRLKVAYVALQHPAHLRELATIASNAGKGGIARLLVRLAALVDAGRDARGAVIDTARKRQPGENPWRGQARVVRITGDADLAAAFLAGEHTSGGVLREVLEHPALMNTPVRVTATRMALDGRRDALYECARIDALTTPDVAARLVECAGTHPMPQRVTLLDNASAPALDAIHDQLVTDLPAVCTQASSNLFGYMALVLRVLTHPGVTPELRQRWAALPLPFAAVPVPDAGLQVALALMKTVRAAQDALVDPGAVLGVPASVLTWTGTDTSLGLRSAAVRLLGPVLRDAPVHDPSWVRAVLAVRDLPGATVGQVMTAADGIVS